MEAEFQGIEEACVEAVVLRAPSTTFRSWQRILIHSRVEIGESDSIDRRSLRSRLGGCTGGRLRNSFMLGLDYPLKPRPLGFQV